MKEFLECHRNDSGNTHKIETLSKKIRFGTVPIRVMKPRAKKRTRIDEFPFPAHVPSTRAKGISQAETHVETTSTTSSEEENFHSEYEAPIKKNVQKRSIVKAEVITSDVVSAIDRCGISNEGTF